MINNTHLKPAFNYKIMLMLLIILYIAFHLLTLSISPLVWHDETIFNRLTLDFITNGTFFQSNCPLFIEGKQHLYYGPVFFMLNGIVLSLFGNNPFQGRLLGLLAGLLILLIICLHYRAKIEKYKIPFCLMVLLLFLDPFFNASMHKGRNDTLALLFYITSLFILKSKENKGFQWHFLSGFFFSLAILTTLRLGFFLIPIIVLYLFRFFNQKEERKITIIGFIIWGITVTLIFSTWIWYAFGSYSAFVSYLQFVKTQLPSLLPFTMHIPVEEYVLIFSIILIIVVFIAGRYRKILLNPNFILYAIHIVLFYLLIEDVGPYSVLIIPFYYMLIFELYISIRENNTQFTVNDTGQEKTSSGGRLHVGLAWEKVNTYKHQTAVFYIMVMLLGLFNCSYFLLKNIVVTENRSARQHTNVEDFIRKNIRPYSRVVGDEIYYYAILNNKCDFQYMHLCISDYDRLEEYRRKVFDYEYLVSSDRLDNRNKSLLPLYRSRSTLSIVACLRTKKSRFNQFITNSGIYPLSHEGYDGVIYKRAKQDLPDD